MPINDGITNTPEGVVESQNKFLEFVMPRTANENFAMRATRPRVFYPQQGISYTIRFLGNVVRTQRYYVKPPHGAVHLLSPDDLRAVVNGHKNTFNRIMRELFSQLSSTSQNLLRPILKDYQRPYLAMGSKPSELNIPAKQYQQDNMVVQTMREVHCLYDKSDWKTCVISHLYVRHNTLQNQQIINMGMPDGAYPSPVRSDYAESPISIISMGKQLYDDMMRSIGALPQGFQSPISGAVAHDIIILRNTPSRANQLARDPRITMEIDMGRSTMPHYDVSVSTEPSVLTEKELRSIYAYGFFDIPQSLKAINNTTATNGHGLVYRMVTDCAGSLSDDMVRMADVDIGDMEVSNLQKKADDIPDALFEKNDMNSSVGSIEI